MLTSFGGNNLSKKKILLLFIILELITGKCNEMKTTKTPLRVWARCFVLSPLNESWPPSANSLTNRPCLDTQWQVTSVPSQHVRVINMNMTFALILLAPILNVFLIPGTDWIAQEWEEVLCGPSSVKGDVGVESCEHFSCYFTPLYDQNTVITYLVILVFQNHSEKFNNHPPPLLPQGPLTQLNCSSCLS